MGDFNFNASKYTTTNIDSADYPLDTPSFSLTTGSSIGINGTTAAQQLWHELLEQHFQECTNDMENDTILPTFRRGTTVSTIDYIYASAILHQSLKSSDIEFVSSKWTDHTIVLATIQFKSNKQGPRLWRAHPNLASNPFFQTTLFEALDASHLEQNTGFRITP